MAAKLWAVYASDPACDVDRRVSLPFGTVWEARTVAAYLNEGRKHSDPLYYAGHVSGDGPAPAGRTDYPHDGARSAVPWGWREHNDIDS